MFLPLQQVSLEKFLFQGKYHITHRWLCILYKKLELSNEAEQHIAPGWCVSMLVWKSPQRSPQRVRMPQCGEKGLASPMNMGWRAGDKSYLLGPAAFLS